MRFIALPCTSPLATLARISHSDRTFLRKLSGIYEFRSVLCALTSVVFTLVRSFSFSFLSVLPCVFLFFFHPLSSLAISSRAIFFYSLLQARLVVLRSPKLLFCLCDSVLASFLSFFTTFLLVPLLVADALELTRYFLLFFFSHLFSIRFFASVSFTMSTLSLSLVRCIFYIVEYPTVSAQVCDTRKKRRTRRNQRIKPENFVLVPASATDGIFVGSAKPLSGLGFRCTLHEKRAKERTRDRYSGTR